MGAATLQVNIFRLGGGDFCITYAKYWQKIVTKYRNGGRGERQADRKTNRENLMFIGPCIILIAE